MVIQLGLLNCYLPFLTAVLNACLYALLSGSYLRASQ